MKWLLLILGFLFTTPAGASSSAVNAGCKRLCDGEVECVQRCVGHAELFELHSDFVEAVADFTRRPEDRMKALRSGANVQILELCKASGWSLENQISCLRSYPTPELMKSCKRLSPRQEEQVRCVKNGKTDAKVEACSHLVPGADRRLECLEMQVSAKEADLCASGDSYDRIRCLRRTESANLDRQRREGVDARIRSERSRARAPASIDP